MRPRSGRLPEQQPCKASHAYREAAIPPPGRPNRSETGLHPASVPEALPMFGAEPERDSFQSVSSQEVLGLLVPEMPIDVASVEQDAVRREIEHPTLFENEDSMRLNQ